MKIREFEKNDLAAVKDLVDKTIDVCYAGIYCAEAVQFFKDWHHSDKILKNAKEGYTIILEQDGRIVGTGTVVGNSQSFCRAGVSKMQLRKAYYAETRRKGSLSGS